jgi:hypothetical protein
MALKESLAHGLVFCFAVGLYDFCRYVGALGVPIHIEAEILSLDNSFGG